MPSIKKFVAGSLMAATLSVGAGVAAMPANAAPVVTGGLVNVTLTDILSGDQINAHDPHRCCRQRLRRGRQRARSRHVYRTGGLHERNDRRPAGRLPALT